MAVRASSRGTPGRSPVTFLHLQCAIDRYDAEASPIARADPVGPGRGLRSYGETDDVAIELAAAIRDGTGNVWDAVSAAVAAELGEDWSAPDAGTMAGTVPGTVPVGRADDMLHTEADSLAGGVAAGDDVQAATWVVVALRPFDKESWPKELLGHLGDDKGSASMQLARIAYMMQHPFYPVARGAGPVEFQVERGDSTNRLSLYCGKCPQKLSATPRKLAEAAEQVNAGRGGPSHGARPERLIAYVADEGEVLFLRNKYAEELARRDRQAAEKARRDRARRTRTSRLGLAPTTARSLARSRQR